MKDLRAYTLANQINEIKIILFKIDRDYAKEAAQGMIDQAGWQESAAVLMPSHPLEANDLLRTQGKALLKLIEFHDLLFKCEEGKTAVKKAEKNMDDISKMFL